MIKLMEFTIKSKNEIDFNSPEFEMIKKKTREEIENRLDKELVEISAFQCNCSKSYDEENGIYLMLIKVYGWPIDYEETNFFINTNKIACTSRPQKEISETLLENAKNHIEVLNFEIEDIKSKIKSVSEIINSQFGTEITPEQKANLDKEAKFLGLLRKDLRAKEATLQYYKEEFAL